MAHSDVIEPLRTLNTFQKSAATTRKAISFVAMRAPPHFNAF